MAGRFRFTLLSRWVLLAFVLLPIHRSSSSGTVQVDARGTRKVCQVVGEFDRQRNVPTVNVTETRFKFWGSDLGASFEHKGKLYVLFGDTHPSGGLARARDADSIAVSNTTNPQDCVRLSFLTEPDGGFRQLQIPGVYSGAFAVPTGGFSLDGRMYILASGDNRERRNIGRSVLARSDDDGHSFRYLYDISRDRMVHVAPVPVPAGQVPDLPVSGGAGLLLWGSGDFRRSDPHLAFLPADAVEQPGALRHFAGLDPVTRSPRWSADEADSVPLFHQPCLGELSAGWNPFLSKWMLLYTCGGPRASTILRTADKPWGPWSAPETLVDPAEQDGECGFISGGRPPQPSQWTRFIRFSRRCPAVSDPHTPSTPGEAYGPYLISRFTQGEPGRSSTIYFLVSTWNPYTVVLMQTRLRVAAGGRVVQDVAPVAPRP
ncbi:DUF4185 domain-containing protein [Teichococcus vastitatis]|uniref:DUF4185 domain-containing protein n=1 Tax=Teichococcus vastitatis TaxID=2307076 RepID=A0ABS9WAQ0_9PROT|nr:DUF4185 domain-containing protein [Pseudoroseomonas vastitatis]MCI0756068.1 DUF4185 domain-containing protein [Pseudoroseomonas vastitatis]